MRSLLRYYCIVTSDHAFKMLILYVLQVQFITALCFRGQLLFRGLRFRGLWSVVCVFEVCVFETPFLQLIQLKPSLPTLKVDPLFQTHSLFN